MFELSYPLLNVILTATNLGLTSILVVFLVFQGLKVQKSFKNVGKFTFENRELASLAGKKSGERRALKSVSKAFAKNLLSNINPIIPIVLEKVFPDWANYLDSPEKIKAAITIVQKLGLGNLTQEQLQGNVLDMFGISGMESSTPNETLKRLIEQEVG